MKKAIICDDSHVSTLVLKKMLKDASVEIIGTALGQNEFEAILETAEKPNFVTMDMVLPDGDGVQACKRLWDKWAKLPVVMVTADEISDAQKTQLSHVVSYVRKPITQEKINTALSSL